jgi:hypothetical protein
MLKAGKESMWKRWGQGKRIVGDRKREYVGVGVCGEKEKS